MDSSERHYVWLCQCGYFKVIQQFVCVIFKVVSNDFTSSFEAILLWQQERKCTKHRDLKEILRLHCMQTVLLDMFPCISAKMVNVSFLCCVWSFECRWVLKVQQYVCRPVSTNRIDKFSEEFSVYGFTFVWQECKYAGKYLSTLFFVNFVHLEKDLRSQLERSIGKPLVRVG